MPYTVFEFQIKFIQNSNLPGQMYFYVLTLTG